MKKLYAIILLLSALLIVPGTASADGWEFEADLSGSQEFPSVVVTNTTGNFEVEFNDDLTEAEFELEVDDGVAVTQAHLHCAPAGANGPIVAFLFG